METASSMILQQTRCYALYTHRCHVTFKSVDRLLRISLDGWFESWFKPQTVHPAGDAGKGGEDADHPHHKDHHKPHQQEHVPNLALFSKKMCQKEIIGPNLIHILLTVFEWMARPTIHTFLPCCPRSAEKMLKRLKIFYPTVGKTWPLPSSCYCSRKIVLTLGCWFLSIGLAVPRSKTPSGRKISFAFGQNQLKSQLLNWTSWFGVQKLIEIGAVSLNFMIGSYLSVQVFSTKEQIQIFFVCLQNYSRLRLRGRRLHKCERSALFSSKELSGEITKHHQQCPVDCWQVADSGIFYQRKSRGRVVWDGGWSGQWPLLTYRCLRHGGTLIYGAWVGQFCKLDPRMLEQPPTEKFVNKFALVSVWWSVCQDFLICCTSHQFCLFCTLI